jgi:hypothetical protein
MMAQSAGRQVLLDRVSEATWQAQVRLWAEREGWHIHVVYNSRRSPEGWPDLFMVRNGRAIAAELKAAGGRLRREQGGWLVWLRECGIEAYVWFPNDEAEVKRVLGVAA